MEISDLILPLGAVGSLAVALYVGWKFYHRYYQAVPPNRALVLYGGSRSHGPSSTNQSVDLRLPRIVVGGGVFVPPWRQGSDLLSLSPLDADARVIFAGTDPTETPWEVRLAVQVKIPVDPRMLSTAAENLLGRSEPEIRALVVRTVEAIAPAVALRELSNDPGAGWDRLAAEIQAAVAPELVAMGLEIRTLSVTQLRHLSTQERTDVSAVGAPHMSRDLLWASGDLGVRLRGVETRLDRTERSLGLLGAEVMRQGKDSSQFPELPALQPYDSTGDERSSRPSIRGSRGAAGGGVGGATRPLLDAEG
ncbi:MAG: SPFH domain-containing protein [Thermoplasmata archaeon]